MKKQLIKFAKWVLNKYDVNKSEIKTLQIDFTLPVKHYNRITTSSLNSQIAHEFIEPLINSGAIKIETNPRAKGINIYSYLKVIS